MMLKMDIWHRSLPYIRNCKRIVVKYPCDPAVSMLEFEVFLERYGTLKGSMENLVLIAFTCLQTDIILSVFLTGAAGIYNEGGLELE